jgi:hypothetical protein
VSQGTSMSTPDRKSQNSEETLTCSYEPKNHRAPPPAWLVADWMLAQHNGQEISEYEEKMCKIKSDNKAILWLRDYLR